MKYQRVKRALDVFISLIAIILLLPLFLIISILIKIDSRGPVIFKQERSGLHKKVFTLYKFRSMKTETPKYCATRKLNKIDCYVTNVGHFLRKTSLDELPQLFNILKGDMSFIGPRPVVITETDLIETRDKYGVNDILPGITGYAQINGRDELEVEEKTMFDSFYKNNISFTLDLSIFLKTFLVVLKREGIKAKDTKRTQKREIVLLKTKTDNYINDDKTMVK